MRRALLSCLSVQREGKEKFQPFTGTAVFYNSCVPLNKYTHTSCTSTLSFRHIGLLLPPHTHRKPREGNKNQVLNIIPKHVNAFICGMPLAKKTKTESRVWVDWFFKSSNQNLAKGWQHPTRRGMILCHCARLWPPDPCPLPFSPQWSHNSLSSCQWEAAGLSSRLQDTTHDY